MSAPLLPALISLIDRKGAIGLDRYMHIALSDPQHGYYTTATPFGVDGDFTTAPEISQVFGELLGVWAVDMWQRMGAPQPFHLVELGPGRGTLMRDALRAAKTVSAFCQAVQIELVEISPRLKKYQAQTLKDIGQKIIWHDSIKTLPAAPSIILANEFFDALPIRQFRRHNEKWQERHINHAHGRLVYEWHDTPPADAPDTALYSTLSADALIEQCPAAAAITAQLGQQLAAHGGVMLVIDYGYATPMAGDSFQAVTKHQPTDPLSAPGQADLTAHVNFAQMAANGCAAGLAASPIITQADFLKNLGAQMRFDVLLQNAAPGQRDNITAARNRLLAPDQMGALFKVLALYAPDQPPPVGFENFESGNTP